MYLAQLVSSFVLAVIAYVASGSLAVAGTLFAVYCVIDTIYFAK